MKTTIFKTIVFASTVAFTTPLVAQVNTVPNKGRALNNFVVEDQGFGFPAPEKSKKESPKVPTSKKDSQLQEIDLKKSFLKRGGVNGGGGDDLALEFKSHAYAGLDELKRSLPKVYDKIDGDSIGEVIKHANIFVVDEALDVQVKELIQNSVAFNSPEQNVILLNRKRLEAIQNQQLLNSIAVHEVLSLKEIERTGYYPISGQLARAQGQSEQTLSSALQVNRLKQIQALSPTASKFEVLKRLFEESQDRISVDEIDSVDGLVAGKFSWNCQIVWRHKPNDLNPGVVAKVVGITKPALPGEPSGGPLFPGKPGAPAVKEMRILSLLGEAKFYRGANLSKINKSLSGLFLDSTMSVLPNQILVKADIFEFAFRKNGPFITFYTDSHYSISSPSGYCYKK